MVRQNGAHFPLEVIRNIDDEGRDNRPWQEKMGDSLWTVPLEPELGVVFRQAGKVTRITNQDARMRMVGMRVFPVGREYQFRPQAAKYPHHGRAGCIVRLYPAIGQPQILSHNDPEQLCSSRRFSCAKLHSTASTHLTPGDVQNARPVALSSELQQDAPDIQFDIVRMRAIGEHFDGDFSHVILHF